MQYWQIVHKYYRKQGFPEDLLSYFCISPEEASQISSIIEKTNPQTILEVGTFIGLSTGIIALASAPESMLVCIDPNLPVEVLSQKFNYYESRGSLVFVRNMLEQFGKAQKTIVLEGYFSGLSASMREKIVSLGGDLEKVTIIGERVRNFAPYDLVFIDGDHFADSVYSDLSLVHPYISQKGIIVLHDMSGYWGNQVSVGITKFIQNHPEFSLTVDHNLGFLSRDAEKAWLIKQKKTKRFLKSVKKKVAPLIK
jgi:predicted O-methyltransferase YrrM